MNTQTSHTDKFLKSKLSLITFILLIAAIGFNILLSLSSLEKLYIESLSASYKIIGNDLQKNIEKALRYGKNIKKFIGINPLIDKNLAYLQHAEQYTEEKSALQNIVDNLSNYLNPDNLQEAKSNTNQYISIAFSDGQILYSTDKNQIGTIIAENIYFFDTSSDKQEEYKVIKTNKRYFITLPIKDRSKRQTATAILSFHEKQVKELLVHALYQNIQTALITISIGLLLFIIIVHFIMPKELQKIKNLVTKFTSIKFYDKPAYSSLPRKKIAIVLFCIIIACQISFSLMSTNTFKNSYLKINKEKAATLNMILKEKVEYLLNKGIDIVKLFRIEISMAEQLKSLPEVIDISILDKNNNILYMADKNESYNFQKQDEKTQRAKEAATHNMTTINAEYNIKIDILKDKDLQGYISNNISRKIIMKKIQEIFFDAMTVLIISILFSLELLIMLFQVIGKKKSDTSASLEKPKLNYNAIRPAAFLMLFGVDSSISFIPLHMKNLYEPILNFSENMVLGLPISAEFLFLGIFTVVAGIWFDKRGWKEPFITGLLITSIGILYSWLAKDAINFIISRGVVGIGFGLSLMSAQGFVMANSDENNKAQGFANLFAGVFSGSICGGATGAMISERIGYTPVFLFGAITVLVVMVYTFVFIKDVTKRTTKIPKVEKGIQIHQLISFLSNKNIIGLIILSCVPSAIAFVGFITYFIPIYLNDIGSSQSNIGRIFMLYGICLVFVAPVISKYIDSSHNKKQYIIIGGIFGSLGFLIFYFLGGITATALSVFILGLSSCFEPSRNAYVLKLNVTSLLGEGKAMSILSSANRIGQVVGPMIIASLIVAVGVRNGIVYFGLIYLIASLLFIFFIQSDKKIEQLK